MVTTSNVLTYLREKGVHANDQWVDQCLSHLKTKGPLGATTQACSEKVFDVFLHSDIHDTVNLVPPNQKGRSGGQEGLLPADLGSKHKVSLSPSKPMILQVDEISNVGASLDHQQQQSKRFLKLFLTDGINSVVGLEHRHVEGLRRNLPAGTKISIKNAPVRHGALLLSSHCVIVLGGEVNKLMDLDKLYAPAEPDDELRGPAQPGHGSIPASAHQSRTSGSPVPPARRDRQQQPQQEQRGHLNFSPGLSMPEGGVAEAKDMEAETQRLPNKSIEDSAFVAPPGDSTLPEVFDLTNSAPSSPPAFRGEAAAEAEAEVEAEAEIEAEADYNAWGHDDFYDDYGYDNSSAVHEAHREVPKQPDLPAESAPPSMTEVEAGAGVADMAIEEDDLLGTPPAVGSGPLVKEMTGRGVRASRVSPSTRTQAGASTAPKLPPIPLSQLATLSAPPVTEVLENTNTPTIYIRGHCLGVTKFKIDKRKKGSSKSLSPGKSSSAPEFEIYVDFDDSSGRRSLRLSSELCEHHLACTPQAYQDRKGKLDDAAAREFKNRTVMQFSHLAGIFSCRWRKMDIKGKKSKRAGADTSLDSAGGSSQDEVELEVVSHVTDPEVIVALCQGNLCRSSV